MKLRLLLSLIAVFCLFTISNAETVKITLEPYELSTLSSVSAIVDIPDINDQLEVSKQAALLALSPEGWNLQSLGLVGFLQYREPPDWYGHFYFVDVPFSQTQYDSMRVLFGFDQNAEGLAHGPDYYLYFHTDEDVGRLSHNVCEYPNNYGVISGGTGGIWAQCTVINWGSFSASPVVLITIDIKPEEYPNSINLSNKSLIPVAIITTEDFDANTVDPLTVKFADASPIKWKMSDVNADRTRDMILYFNIADLKLTVSSTEATLTGKTIDGKEILSKDSVKIVTKGKK